MWEEVYKEDKSRSARCSEGSEDTYSVLFCLHSQKQQAGSTVTQFLRQPGTGTAITQLRHLKELLWGQEDTAIWGNCTDNFDWKEKICQRSSCL